MEYYIVVRHYSKHVNILESQIDIKGVFTDLESALTCKLEVMESLPQRSQHLVGIHKGESK